MDLARRRLYPVRGRVLFFYGAVSLIVSIGLIAFAWPGWRSQSPRPPLPWAIWFFIWYALYLALLMRPLSRSGGSLRTLIGRIPITASTLWATTAAFALVGTSMASLYVVFLPLSYAVPGFVQWWLFDDPIVVIWTRGHLYPLANVVNFITVVLLGPFVEELVFRGLLLPAWAARLGAKWAVIWSSLIFALLHPDIVGAFIFSVVVAVAFLKTRALWLPIVIHVTNNLLAWTIEAGSVLLSGESTQTLADFQSMWWLGLAGLLVGVPLLIGVLRNMPGTFSLDRRRLVVSSVSGSA